MNRKFFPLRNLVPVALAALLALVASPLVRPLLALQAPAAQENRPGGEANLLIPDLSSVQFFGLPGHTLLMAGLVVCALGLLFGLVIYGQLKRLPVHESMKKVGKLAFRSILYFEVVTTLALAVGLIAVNLVRPGEGVGLDTTAQVSATVTDLSQRHVTFSAVLEHIVPSSFVDAAARNEVLQVVFWSIIFAVAVARTPAGPKKTMLGVIESLSEVMFKFVGIVMAFAPFGIGAAIAVTVGQSGIGVLRNLGILVLTLYGALVVFVLVVLVPVAVIFRIPVAAFWKTVREPWLIAFSTASSEAALPLAMQKMEAFGVPRRIVAFVMPTGYSFNLDGSTLYLALASVFVAQAANIDMAKYSARPRRSSTAAVSLLRCSTRCQNSRSS